MSPRRRIPLELWLVEIAGLEAGPVLGGEIVGGLRSLFMRP